MELSNFTEYSDLMAAGENTQGARILNFIETKREKCLHYLDSDWFHKMQNNDFPTRYWELLCVCLLMEQCGTEIMKPKHKENTPIYDLEVI